MIVHLLELSRGAGQPATILAADCVHLLHLLCERDGPGPRAQPAYPVLLFRGFGTPARPENTCTLTVLNLVYIAAG